MEGSTHQDKTSYTYIADQTGGNPGLNPRSLYFAMEFGKLQHLSPGSYNTYIARRWK